MPPPRGWSRRRSSVAGTTAAPARHWSASRAAAARPRILQEAGSGQANFGFALERPFAVDLVDEPGDLAQVRVDLGAQRGEVVGRRLGVAAHGLRVLEDLVDTLQALAQLAEDRVRLVDGALRAVH